MRSENSPPHGGFNGFCGLCSLQGAKGWENHVALSVAASSACFVALVCPKLILSHPFVLLSIVFGWLMATILRSLLLFPTLPNTFPPTGPGYHKRKG